MLLVGFHALKGMVRRDLALLDRDCSEINRLAVGAPPVGQILEAFVHLARLELILVVIVIAAVTASVRAVVFRRSALLDRDERQMQIASCLRRRGLEERRDSRIDTLEIGE